MDFVENLYEIKAKIELEACAQNLTIEAVSKGQPQHKIDALLKCGHRVFAENKVQEAVQHWQDLRIIYPELRLHFIGKLQRNKVPQAVALFDVIETVDSIKLAEAIATEAKKTHKSQHIMLQVNIGKEPQKAGITIAQIDELLNFCLKNQYLKLEGLMCIPPQNLPPEPYFVQMQQLQQQFRLPHLSMGMSGDYISAIRLGATHIRLGTALFGERGVAA